MKYIAKIGETEFPVELTQVGETWLARVDGHEYTVSLNALNKKHLVLVQNGRVFDIVLSGDETVYVNGRPFSVELTDARIKQLRVLSGQSSREQGPAPVKAPMPGLVLHILVQEGQHVKKHDGLLVIEAMKMENEIRADRDGIIRKIHVQPGQAVDKDQLLIEVG